MEELKWKSRVAVDYIKPTFVNFFSSEELEKIFNSASVIAQWDFVNCLGDTIREKYEFLTCQCGEVTQRLIDNGAVGYFWMVASREITSIFETASFGYTPAPSNNVFEYEDLGVSPMGLPEVTYHGSLYNKWRIYSDSCMPKNVILIGCNDVRQDDSHYGKIIVKNYVI